ncbi:hypothetical protein VTO73DRAFT_1057 [Trametes versicolor]
MLKALRASLGALPIAASRPWHLPTSIPSRTSDEYDNSWDARPRWFRKALGKLRLVDLGDSDTQATTYSRLRTGHMSPINQSSAPAPKKGSRMENAPVRSRPESRLTSVGAIPGFHERTRQPFVMFMLYGVMNVAGHAIAAVLDACIRRTTSLICAAPVPPPVNARGMHWMDLPLTGKQLNISTTGCTPSPRMTSSISEAYCSQKPPHASAPYVVTSHHI